MKKIIELINITVKYNVGRQNEFTALNNVDFCINEGDMTAIVGPSGSGKSTLLHTIGFLLEFQYGSYIFDGKSVADLKEDDLAKLRNNSIGYIMQDFALIENRTVYENVALPLLFSNVPYKKINGKVDKILKIINIYNLKKRQVNELSGGQKQRVAIARALVVNPRIILADEPTGSLDEKTSIEIMEILKKLNEQGKTILVVTHNPIISKKCSETHHLLDGELYA